MTGIGLAPSSYVRSAAHTTLGLVAGAQIEPLTVAGLPSANGRIVMIGIGMSNAKLVQNRFYLQMLVTQGGDPDRHPAFRYVRCAQNGYTSEAWSVATHVVWANCNTYITTAGFSALQVQAAHVMMTRKYPLGTNGVPEAQDPGPMSDLELRAIIDNLNAKYPNLRVVILSGLNYTGYSNDVALSPNDRWRAPEPYTRGDSLLMAAVVTNGGLPVWTDFTDLWSDGITPNPLTGVNLVCSDVEADGVHPTVPQGVQKLATFLRLRWKSDPIFHGWMFQ